MSMRNQLGDTYWGDDRPAHMDKVDVDHRQSNAKLDRVHDLHDPSASLLENSDDASVVSSSREPSPSKPPD
jgi:hypothetical protein